MSQQKSIIEEVIDAVCFEMYPLQVKSISITSKLSLLQVNDEFSRFNLSLNLSTIYPIEISCEDTLKWLTVNDIVECIENKVRFS